MGAMTKTEIDRIFERVRSWPQEQQERAAAILLALEEQGTGTYELTNEELAAVEEAEAEADRGEFVTEEEIKTVFDRYRRR